MDQAFPNKIVNDYKKFIRNYFNVNGRADLSEFWDPFCTNLVLLMLLQMLEKLFSKVAFLGGLFNLMDTLLAIFVLVPTLTASVRRLHDTGKDWKPMLWLILPVIGWIILAIMLLRRSEGTNVYGVPGNVDGAAPQPVTSRAVAQRPPQPQQPAEQDKEELPAPLYPRSRPGQRKIYPQHPPQANDPYAPAEGQPVYPEFQTYQQEVPEQPQPKQRKVYPHPPKANQGPQQPQQPQQPQPRQRKVYPHPQPGNQQGPPYDGQD